MIRFAVASNNKAHPSTKSFARETHTERDVKKNTQKSCTNNIQTASFGGKRKKFLPRMTNLLLLPDKKKNVRSLLLLLFTFSQKSDEQREEGILATMASMYVQYRRPCTYSSTKQLSSPPSPSSPSFPVKSLLAGRSFTVEVAFTN